MKEHKKLEIQNTVIQKLKVENKELSLRVLELEQEIQNNKKIVETANNIVLEDSKRMNEITAIKKQYHELLQSMLADKKKYQKDMESIMKTIGR